MFVLVPPNRPTIYDGQRRDRTKLVEPYNEGSDVLLICEVEGGKVSIIVPKYFITVIRCNGRLAKCCHDRSDANL